jgi:hypothetical protein
MGALVPIAFLIAAYVSAAMAVITAITAITLVAIIAAIVSALAAASATYFYIQGDIKNSMLFSGIALAAGIGSVYLTFIEQTQTIGALLSEGTANAISAAASMESSAVLQLAGYVQTAYSAWSTFADYIQLKLLWQINQIAYLVSADYRAMMNNVFQQVAKVSEEFGYGALTLNLLFENTRRGVLDISSAMGKSYDLGEVEWLNTYNALLKQFADNASHYQKSPGDFLQWIADNTDRPGYDAKSATMRTVMSGVESALGLTRATAEAATKIRSDLLKLIGDLPEVIRKQWEPEVKKIVKQFDDFMRLNYDPAIKQISSAFVTVGKMIDEDRAKAQVLTDRLKRPGKYLAEIKDLPEPERMADEDSVASIVESAQDRAYEPMSELTAGIEEMNKEMAEKEIEIPPPPPVMRGKISPYVWREVKLVRGRKTPYVGEY